MEGTVWKIPEEETVIPEELLGVGCTPLLAALLAQRGLGTPAQAIAFLDCDAVPLRNPMTMAGMPAAVARLRRAIALRETVAVYGDYDVDGITSGCMLTDYLRGHGVQCQLYIPDRLREGYGVNRTAVRKLWDAGVTLLVTVDCGITALEETALANTLGMDVIITDHHECLPELPPALAVVDPRRPDCPFQNEAFAGVGVAFKLLCALEGNADEILARYADVVAVGTVADVVPLTGENRSIVRKGLEKLVRNPRSGFRALIRASGLEGRKLSAINIGFTLAPRINAAGRLGQTEQAVSLLLGETDKVTDASAETLCQLNRERQAMEMNIWRQALDMLGKDMPEGPIVLAGEGWHQGVVGIVASRLVETYHVPTVMISLDGESGRGSCRSCGDFNLFAALCQCEGLLERFGGHALAAGLDIRREKIDEFRRALGAYYTAHPPQYQPALDIDLCVDAPELLSMACVEDLEKLEPCGAGNPKPALCLLGAKVTEMVTMGGGKHLRVWLEKFGQRYEAVFFSHAPEDLALTVGDWADAAFTPQINSFRGQKNVQLLLSGLRKHRGEQAMDILAGRLSENMFRFFPERSEFAQVWRALTALGGQCQGELPELVERLACRMKEEKFSLILKVFQEFHLITLDCRGQQLSCTQCAISEKVDLAASKILARLREVHGGE